MLQTVLGDGARITFEFLRCSLCRNAFQPTPTTTTTASSCPLSSLSAALSALHLLQRSVHTQALLQLEAEGRHTDPAVCNAGGRFHHQPLEYALHLYVYYQCFVCKKPYFGGHYQCQPAPLQQIDEKILICAAYVLLCSSAPPFPAPARLQALTHLLCCVVLCRCVVCIVLWWRGVWWVQAQVPAVTGCVALPDARLSVYAHQMQVLLQLCSVLVLGYVTRPTPQMYVFDTVLTLCCAALRCAALRCVVCWVDRQLPLL